MLQGVAYRRHHLTVSASVYNAIMPRKIRDYKADIVALGFTEQPRRGKGSHRVWKHLKLRENIVIAFKDGEDVPPYMEQQLKKARKQLKADS